MKIIFVNEHALYWNGGIRYLYEVTRRLAQKFEVSLVVQDISDENYKRFRSVGVEVCDLMETTANKLRYWIFYPFYLLKNAYILGMVKNDYDCWVSVSPTTHIVCMLARVKPVLCVFELNPWLFDFNYQRGLSKTKRFIIKCGSIFAKWLEKKAYQNASKIIVYSKYIQSEVERVYKVDSEVVYTGVDADFFKPTRNAELEKKYEGKQIVLHVASYLSPMKGTDLAVGAMGIVNQEFPDALLLIINSHNDVERQEELKEKAEQCGAKIEFVTSVAEEDMPAYYTMAKCLLSPSLDENIHLPVIEASACETPCVGLIGNMGSEDIIKRNTGWLALNFSKGDINLAHFMRILLKYENIRENMGKNARRFVRERFSWDKCVGEYERIISEVVNGSKV